MAYGKWNQQQDTAAQGQQQPVNQDAPQNQPQGGQGNKPTEILNYSVGMASAKLLDWGRLNKDGSPQKPTISLQIRTFNPTTQKNTWKTIDTSSVEAIVSLKFCLDKLVDELITNRE